jgi:hypothetical protein
MEAAARSFPPIEPICLRWTFPTWTIAPDLDATKLKRDRPAKRAKAEAEPKPAWTAESFADRFISDEPRTLSAIVIEADAEKLSERKVKKLLEAAEDAGRAFCWTPRNPNRPARYATVPQPVTDLESEATA